MTDLQQVAAVLGAVALGLIGLLKYKRAPVRESGVVAFLHSDEGRKLVHRAARHEIANAVMLVSSAINSEAAPACVDSYRRAVLTRVVAAFRSWKEEP